MVCKCHGTITVDITVSDFVTRSWDVAALDPCFPDLHRLSPSLSTPLLHVTINIGRRSTVAGASARVKTRNRKEKRSSWM